MNDKENFSKITLSGKVYIENEHLFIDYTVKNDLPDSIYIFDEMIEYDESGQPKINRKTAYCFWEEPGTLRIVRAVLRIPLEKDVYSLEMPYAREIKSRSSLSGKVELELPVKEKSPFYALPGEENSKIANCEKVRLIIGWTQFSEGTKITEADVGGEKVLRIRGNWKPKLAEEYFNLSTRVLIHTDTFDRQLPQH